MHAYSYKSECRHNFTAPNLGAFALLDHTFVNCGRFALQQAVVWHLE